MVWALVRSPHGSGLWPARGQAPRSSWHSPDRGPGQALDAVLHVAAGAIEVLVKRPPAPAIALERGHHEARIGLALRPFRLGDDAAPARPAVQRRPAEVLEPARRPARRQGLVLGPGEFRLDLGDKAGIAGQPEDVIDPVDLATCPSAPRGRSRNRRARRSSPWASGRGCGR